MRKIFLAPAFLFFVSASMAQKNNEETIEGNGKLVTREVHVSAFDAIKAEGIYDLKLSQADKESVKIEADENIQELIQVNNEGSKLVIGMKKLEHKNLKLHDKVKVYVTFRKLSSLDLSLVGNTSSESSLSFDDIELKNQAVGNVALKLTANKLNLKNTGVGNVNLSGKAENAEVVNSGVGSLQASDFVVQNMNIENTGVGSASVNADKNLKVKDSFLGKVRNRGAATVRKMNKVVI